MNNGARALAVACAVVAVAACGQPTSPPYGGDKEIALTAATAARDVAKVKALLAAGANPNPMVRHEGLYQSAWYIALNDVRPSRPESIALVKAMLGGGANPEAAWGSGVARGITRTSDQPPIMIAMLHPEPEVVRALISAGLKPQHAQTALVMAIETGESEIAHLLVEAGVDVNCHPGANTPLVAAIETRNVALMNYLEEHGAREKP
jgi:ankyrin repeat protein